MRWRRYPVTFQFLRPHVMYRPNLLSAEKLFAQASGSTLWVHRLVGWGLGCPETVYAFKLECANGRIGPTVVFGGVLQITARRG